MPRRMFTHLLPPDASLMASFLAANPTRYDNIDFDVRVGRGSDPGPDFPPTTRSLAVMLSQRRIDAVGYAEEFIDIIEVTVTAGLKALGQLIAYPLLYKSTFNPDRPVAPLLITAAFRPDVRTLFDQLQIPYILVALP